MEELYLPVLSHFQNENGWTGSGGQLRYTIVPEEETLVAEVWQGPWSYEFARVEEQRVFPMEDGGLVQLAEWLTEWRHTMDTRPKPTLAETLGQREAIVAQRTAEVKGGDE